LALRAKYVALDFSLKVFFKRNNFNPRRYKRFFQIVFKFSDVPAQFFLGKKKVISKDSAIFSGVKGDDSSIPKISFTTFKGIIFDKINLLF